MQIDYMQVGQIVTQFYGPRTGVNYGGTNPAYCDVILTALGGSSAAFLVQVNSTPIAGYDDTQQILIPSPAGWSTVATITSAGLTQTALTPTPNISWVQVSMSVVGVGTVTAGGNWARRGA